MEDFLDPDTAYISISKQSGNRLREMGIMAESNWDDARKVLIAAIGETAKVIEGTIETHLLIKIHIENETVDRSIALICVVTPGSPAGDKKYTTLIRGALSEDAMHQLLSQRKGLTCLKYDSTIGKIGDAAGLANGEDLSRSARSRRIATEKAPHLSKQERHHLAVLIDQKEFLWGWLNANPKSSPTYNLRLALLRAINWAIDQVTNRGESIKAQSPAPATSGPAIADTFTPPVSIKEGERLREELAAAARQMSAEGGRSEYDELGARLRQLNTWLHRQRQHRELLILQDAFKLLSEAVATDAEDAIKLRKSFYQQARDRNGLPSKSIDGNRS
jgi:hypothetical protein